MAGDEGFSYRGIQVTVDEIMSRIDRMIDLQVIQIHPGNPVVIHSLIALAKDYSSRT